MIQSPHPHKPHHHAHPNHAHSHPPSAPPLHPPRSKTLHPRPITNPPTPKRRRNIRPQSLSARPHHHIAHPSRQTHRRPINSHDPARRQGLRSDYILSFTVCGDGFGADRDGGRSCPGRDIRAQSRRAGPNYHVAQPAR